MKAAFLLPMAVLAACSQNPDGTTALGVKGSPAWFMTAPPEAIASHYQTSCQSYGYQHGTADMARCVERSAEGARSASRQGMSEAMTRFGQQQYANRTVTCNSHAYGPEYMTTRCY